MRFDDIDIGIIHYLHDNPNKTTSDIAKTLFECETSRDLLKQDSLIRARLNKLTGKKVIIRSPTTPKTYYTNPECVFCGEGLLSINIDKGKKIEIDFGNFLVVTNSDDYVYINRISQGNQKGYTVEVKNFPNQ